MAARALHPSELEIQREVEALRVIRRRSITPGALAIDPDLPPNQAATTESPSASIPRRRSSRRSSATSDDSSAPIDDPFHLFWVPASLHPEIAPAEFRAFLKEHARAPSPQDDSGLSRSFSTSSLARTRSMLSRQYQPSENDDVEDEQIVPLKRTPSDPFARRGPQLTIKDLEKLEQLAEEASTSDDPSKFRNILRRSLSLNISPSAALSHIEEVPDIVDEADSPIIVPPPGQILRRAARTKIRKPGLPGDGGGHRFASTRRVQARAATAPLEPRSSSDRSSSDHGESLESVLATPEATITSVTQRPESYSEETFIIDAYARDDDDDLKAASSESTIIVLQDSGLLLPLSSLPLSDPPQLSIPDVSATLFDALEPALVTSQPQDVTIPQPPEPDTEPQHQPQPQPQLESEPEPESVQATALPLEVSTSLPPQVEITPLPVESPIPRPPLQPTAPIPTAPTPPPRQRKEKDKKGGLFGKWGGDKASKKAQKNTSSERETSFFGSLFGGSKKKPESEPISSTTGRETAQALLGTSKSSKNHVQSTSPGHPLGVSPNNYARYPIHVERAIYRLSHIKLANPRRPLYEQVLISNLMFWYLGVINKTQSPTQQPNGQPPPNSLLGQAMAAANQANDIEKLDRDRMEREQNDRVEKERLELDRERMEREAEMKKKESGRRGTLTKTPPGSLPGGGRRAEKPIKGPQYEMQHRVMEQEYGNYAAQAQQGMPLARIHSAPVGGTNPGPGQQLSWGSSSSPQLVQPLPQSPMPDHVYDHDPNSSPTLPNRTGHSPPPRQPSPLPPEHRSRSPPIQSPQRPSNASRYSPNSSRENLAAVSNGRLTGRSLSATALPSPPMYQANGRARKGASAYASIPTQGKPSISSERQSDENGFEEEDVPLAVWQQQRRR
ncbi:hypothetical protein APHAL10511_004378 [Amanita phalloides]|nr:hypothetical protein APHAL10511_004378 [Amanita phalloides]